MSESAYLTKTLTESLEEMLKEADLDMEEDLRAFEDVIYMGNNSVHLSEPKLLTKTLNEDLDSRLGDLNKLVDENVFDDDDDFFNVDKIVW